MSEMQFNITPPHAAKTFKRINCYAVDYSPYCQSGVCLPTTRRGHLAEPLATTTHTELYPQSTENMGKNSFQHSPTSVRFPSCEHSDTSAKPTVNFV